MQNSSSNRDILAAFPPRPGLVLLMCGVAGSGKTTLSQKFEAAGFGRLSIDEVIWGEFGRYGIDYAAENYAAHVASARIMLREMLVERLSCRAPTVVDSSFWSRSHRDDFKQLIETHGCTSQLIYLRPADEVLRVRLRRRNDRFDANAALPIDEAMLDKYLLGFEAPIDEGEIVIVEN